MRTRFCAIFARLHEWFGLVHKPAVSAVTEILSRLARAGVLGLAMIGPLAADPGELEQIIAEVQDLRDRAPQLAVARLDTAIADLQGRELSIEQLALFRLRAEIRRGLGDYAAAEVDAEAFRVQAEASGEIRLLADALLLLGTIAAEQTRIAQAMDYFHQVRQMLTGTEYLAQLARAYNALGVAHTFSHDHERARPYFERALTLAREAEHGGLEANALANLASAVAALEGPEAGLPLYRETSNLARARNDLGLMALTQANLCDWLIRGEQLEEAEDTCADALVRIRALDQARPLAGTLMTVGDLRLRQARGDDARALYEEALTVARDRVLHVESTLLMKLADWHEQHGQPEQAVAYLRELLQLQARMREEAQRTLVEELEVRFRVEEGERALTLARLEGELTSAQLRQRNTWLIGLSLGLLLAIGLAVVALRGYRKEAELEDALSERNRQLEMMVRRVGELASRDSLTGLLNRRAFAAAAGRELHAAERSGQPLVVAMGDIDLFKQLNDAHGHHVGDEVLREIAIRLKAAVRTVDLVCRWGGEEFVCLFVGMNATVAADALDRIRAGIGSAPIETSIGPIRVTMTFGVAEAGADLDLAVQAADAAMYRGKRNGRDRVVQA